MKELLILLLWVAAIYGFYLRISDKKARKEKASYKRNSSSFVLKSGEQKEIEARQVADGIKTHKGIEGLENRIDTLSEKMDDYHFEGNDLMYEKTKKKQEILELALTYAGENPYRYYYAEEPDVDTPLEELKMIGKTISRQKYHELSDELRDYYDFITLEEADSIEEANEYAKDNLLEDHEMKDLMSFRKIIESDLNDTEKEEKFNKLVSKSDYLMENLYLETEINTSLYEQYLHNEEENEKLAELYEEEIEKIAKLGALPHADFFVDNGYETIQEIKALSDKDILSINGVGKKRLEEIREYLNSLKSA